MLNKKKTDLAHALSAVGNIPSNIDNYKEIDAYEFDKDSNWGMMGGVLNTDVKGATIETPLISFSQFWVSGEVGRHSHYISIYIDDENLANVSLYRDFNVAYNYVFYESTIFTLNKPRTIKIVNMNGGYFSIYKIYYTPLYLAIGKENIEIIKLLLANNKIDLNILNVLCIYTL